MYYKQISKSLTFKVLTIIDTFLVNIVKFKFNFPHYFSILLKPQIKGKLKPLRNWEIEELAKYLGFSKTNEKVHNQFVYTDGSYYIVQDLDSHIGGIWKMARSVNDLRSKKTRLGTYDPLLNRMGD